MVKVFKNFKEVTAIRPGFTVEAIHGGALLGVVGADAITFYDWATQTVRCPPEAHDPPCMAAQGAGRYTIHRRASSCRGALPLLQGRTSPSSPSLLHSPSCLPADQWKPFNAALGHDPQVVRRIDVPVRAVKWADSGELVALLSEASFYVLSYDADVRFLRCAWVPCVSRQYRCNAGTAWHHPMQGESVMLDVVCHR